MQHNDGAGVDVVASMCEARGAKYSAKAIDDDGDDVHHRSDDNYLLLHVSSTSMYQQLRQGQGAEASSGGEMVSVIHL